MASARQREAFALLSIPAARSVASRAAKTKEFQGTQPFSELEPHVWPQC